MRIARNWEKGKGFLFCSGVRDALDALADGLTDPNDLGDGGSGDEDDDDDETMTTTTTMMVATPVCLEFPILSLNPGLRQRCVAPDV